MLLIVSKCYIITVTKRVGTTHLYVWDLKASIDSLHQRRVGSKLVRVDVQPFAQLEYTPVDVDYIFLQAANGNGLDLS